MKRQIRRILGDEKRVSSVRVSIGKPAPEINAAATAVAADLVVLGSHRRRPAFDDLLGTTADRVIRISSIPCLIAGRPPKLPLRHVLVPIDFSEPSIRALEVGIDWLAGVGALGVRSSPITLQILYVSAFALPGARPVAVEPLLEMQRKAARERIQPGMQVKVEPLVLYAPLPVDGIREAAEDADTDLIIMGTHGQGNLERALLGSIASRTVRTVPFSILLVPPPLGKPGELVSPLSK